MEIKLTTEILDGGAHRWIANVIGESGEMISKGSFTYRNTRFGNKWVKTMTAGGIYTPVHLRRGGNVRKTFEYMQKKAYEDGIVTALLHPFSFTYYNMFGYEKISDHLIVRLPIRFLDFLPRRCSLVPYTDELLADVASAYERFSAGRNIMFERKSEKQFNFYPGCQTYVYYENGRAEGYITYSTTKEVVVNHHENGLMTVHEMVYTSPAVLAELLSFIRMYEGELEDVEFSNLGMCPEVDMIFRNYTHTRYKLLPDVAAKIINTEKMLTLCEYPEAEGELTISVPEGDEGVKGVFRIEWGGNDHRVTKLADNAEADVTVSDLMLGRLIYGYDMINPTTLPYVRGVEVHKNAAGFMAAFPKKNNGAFEHF